MSNEATDEVELISEAVLTSTGKVATKCHEVDDANKVRLLAVEGHVPAVLWWNTCLDHLVIKCLRLFDKRCCLLTEDRVLVNVSRNGHSVLNGLRHLGGDAVGPSDSTTGELRKADSANAFDSNLEVEGLLRNREGGSGKDLLTRLDVLRIGGIVLLITKGVPGLAIPVPEHLEGILSSGIEECYLDVAEAVCCAHFTSKLFTIETNVDGLSYILTLFSFDNNRLYDFFGDSTRIP